MRIQEKFHEVKIMGRKALITFITAGDPDLGTTKRLIVEMEKRGADLIELGIPYSDPIAEGPVIQLANARALKNSLKIRDIMRMVAEVRKEVHVPILFLLYYNCILQYGPETFLEDCVRSGVDGLIIPDLPFEEKGELKKFSGKVPVDIISLVSPTSRERVEKIAKDAEGFLYCVSSLGVTGMRNDFSTDFDEFFSNINRVTDIPTALGFGISTPEHIRKLKKYCDGLIVGSAVVKRIEDSRNPDEAVTNTGRFVQSLREAMDEDL